MNLPIKVLQIGLSSNLGGIETCILNYYKYIDKTKIQFDFVDIYGEGLAYTKEITKLGGKIFVLQNFKKHPIKFTYSLYKILKTNSYSVVHINMLSSANIIPAIISCFNKNTSVILHSHNSNIPKGTIRRIMHYLNIFILRKLPAKHYACGEKAGKWMFGKNFSKSNIITNAIDIELFKQNIIIRNKIRNKCAFNNNEIIIGFVGRLCEQKNVLFLADILQYMCKISQQYKMLFIGDGELRHTLIKKIEKLNLQNQVYFAGIKNNISEWYQAMDIFLLPSFFEGLGIVAIEAQCSGLPCFVSNEIPDQAIICNTIKIPLSKSAKEWADIILEKVKNFKRHDHSQIIKQAGYDIKDAINTIEKIYLDLNNI